MSREELQAALQRITQQLQPQPQQPPPPDLTTPQTQPLQGMVENRAGGFSYAVDDLTRLRRFIVIGSESGSYNAQRQNNQSPAAGVAHIATNLISNGRGGEVIDTITKFAEDARVAREENILLVLRECALYNGDAMYNENTTIQRAAYDRVVRICNIPTKLFRFIELCEARLKDSWKPIEIPLSKSQKRKRANAQKKAAEAEKVPLETEYVEEEQPATKKKKKKKKKKKPKKKEPAKAKTTRMFKRSTAWGRQRRRGIAQFYNDPNKSAERLLLLLTKYQMRHNWSHKQVLCYAHPKFVKDDEEAFQKNIVMKYCTRGFEKCVEYVAEKTKAGNMDAATSKIMQYIRVLEDVKKLSVEKPEDVKKMLELINEYGVRAMPEEYTMIPPGQFRMRENTEQKRVAFQLCREHLPTGFLKLPEVFHFQIYINRGLPLHLFVP